MSAQLRIIIAEDDDDQRNGIRDFFTLKKHSVTAVATGCDFYKELEGESFDVAVLDIGLPDQSGLVLAEYLRANSNTGIIILSGRDEEENQLKGYDSGADFYLTKPVSSHILSAAVTRLAERVNSAAVTRPAGRVEIKSPQTTGSLPVWTLNRLTSCVSFLDNKAIRITSVEYKFLELLATSQKQISSRGYLKSQLHLSADTHKGSLALDALVQGLRAKLSPNSRSETDSPLKSIYGYGYSFSEPFKIIQ